MANTGQTISQIVASLPRYEIVKTKFECRREDAEKAVEAVKAAFTTEKVDLQDGIRIDWDNSWVHARPSNTEPIMRIIAEAPDRKTADEKIALVQAVVDKALK
jgi:phosphomannomutase